MIGKLVVSCSSNPDLHDDQNAAPINEAIYLWLDHMLHSRAWESSRRLLSPTYILAACEKAPHYYTNLLKDGLEKRNNTGHYFDISTTNKASVVGGDTVTSDLQKYLKENTHELEDSRFLEEIGWHIFDKWEYKHLTKGEN